MTAARVGNAAPPILASWEMHISARVFVDPTDAHFVYVAQTSMYRSTDGGRTFEAWRRAEWR